MAFALFDFFHFLSIWASRTYISRTQEFQSRDLLFVSFSNLVWFVRFYSLDVVAPSVASSILSTRLVEC